MAGNDPERSASRDTKGASLERQAALRTRREQLRSRSVRLRAGEPSTAEDVADAISSLIDALHWSERTHRRAYEADAAAAERHRRAADTFEALGHADRAAEHRRLATIKDHASQRHTQSAADERDTIARVQAQYPRS